MTKKFNRRFSSTISLKKCFQISILFCALLLVTSCSSFLYYPQKFKYYSPEKFGLNQEEVFFTNKEGTKLHGWWFSAKTQKALGTWVFFHGNGGNITSHFMGLAWLPDLGYNYFIFDYPGYGESLGDPSPYENVMSGIAALEWVQKNKDQSALTIYGQSMGGIIAMRTALEVKDQVPVKVVIADGTFSSFKKIARNRLAQHWLTGLLRPLTYLVLSDRWAPDVEKLSPIPLIVIHGEDDRVIPIEFGEEIYNDAKEPKAYLPVELGQHGNLFWVGDRGFRETLLEKITEMTKSVLTN